MKGYRIGIDVGGTKTAYGLFDSQMNLLDKLTTPSDKTLPAEAFSDGVIEDTRAFLNKNGLKYSDLDGIGIGLPSFIKFDEGYVYKTVNLTNIKEFPAKEYFQSKMDVKVILDNDANTAALAEHRHGAGRGFEHMLYCPMSTGISNGIIINGKLFRGSYGWAGETGHMLITPDEGVMCGCENKGCFMSHISGSMIVELVKRKLSEGEKSILPEIAGGVDKLSAATIKQGCEQGDALSLWALEHMAYYAGVWLFNTYEAFNINCFVFGGGLVNFGDMLFGRIRKVFDHYNSNELPVYFKFAELKQDFGIIGAAELVED